jgi:hypothetical protein
MINKINNRKKVMNRTLLLYKNKNNSLKFKKIKSDQQIQKKHPNLLNNFHNSSKE